MGNQQTQVAAGGVPTAADLDDIQGNTLRGYGLAVAYHFSLTIGDASKAASFLGVIVSGDEAKSPQVTTAAHWSEKPAYALNIGITAQGLKNVGVPADAITLFPTSFQQGAEKAAPQLGDANGSGPDNWEFGGANGTPDFVVSLYSNTQAVLDQKAGEIKQVFADHALTVLTTKSATAMPDGTVHFGYRDGIAQPQIAGTPGADRPPDMQPEAPTGDFLLGKNSDGTAYQNVFKGNYLSSIPAELANNATYGVMRVLNQDVKEFHAFVEEAATRIGHDPNAATFDATQARNWVKAKMMGRWPNGAPLVQYPNEMPPDGTFEAKINEFDYAPTDANPTYFDDHDGVRCPVGSHARRMNPRSATVMGMAHSRRIVRRAMPYGPAWDPNDAETERGLIGWFICGDISMQFEFLQRIWANKDLATSGLRGTQDPIIGAQDKGGRFVIRTEDTRDPIIFDTLKRLVTTKGSAYCLIPGTKTLAYLATLA